MEYYSDSNTSVCSHIERLFCQVAALIATRNKIVHFCNANGRICTVDAPHTDYVEQGDAKSLQALKSAHCLQEVSLCDKVVNYVQVRKRYSPKCAKQLFGWVNGVWKGVVNVVDCEANGARAVEDVA